MYPEFIEVNGRQYKINTDYRIGLACLKAIDDPDITDVERTYAILGLLFDDDIVDEDIEKVVKLSEEYLVGNNSSKESNNNIKDIDLNYDRDYIESSFMSVYHLDIDRENLHWWKFLKLISGFTNDCIMNQVREIRNYDINDISDQKQKQVLINLKERLKIPDKKTNKELQAINKFESLFL